jgi:cytochrome c553
MSHARVTLLRDGRLQRVNVVLGTRIGGRMNLTTWRALRAATIAALGLAALPAQAFHSGGVGACEGCHTMHNSLEGEAMAPVLPQYQSGPYLLRGTDASSACLNCHQERGQTTDHLVSTADADMPTGSPPRQLTPAGDFGWLKKSYTWTTDWGSGTSPGERHGHNIIAADYGYVADQTNALSPSDSYPSAYLACHSCHDPHGQYRRFADGSMATTGLPIFDSGSYADSPDPIAGVSAAGVYRHLAGVGYQPKSLPGSLAFQHPSPDAVSPARYNRSEALTQTRVAYGRGFSEWCANCHPAMLSNGYTSGMPGLRHPAGNDAPLGAVVAASYAAYVVSGNLRGSVETSYSSLTPFEEAIGDYATLKAHARDDDTYLAGPAPDANVSCLSCHRSHASGFDSKLRYGLGNEFITLGDADGNPSYPDPATNPEMAQGRTVEETTAAYYGRPATRFAPFQRALCNKCHAKD